jgi:hypothetical protein
MFAPAERRRVIKTLNAALQDAVSDPEITKTWADQGFTTSRRINARPRRPARDEERMNVGVRSSATIIFRSHSKSSCQRTAQRAGCNTCSSQSHIWPSRCLVIDLAVVVAAFFAREDSSSCPSSPQHRSILRSAGSAHVPCSIRKGQLIFCTTPSITAPGA